ncbi:MAG: valine--tRNA ligase, partial [Firmicutes bacterium]|nr:valine--tRNA ligase [Bacillota bacterium]
EYIKTQANVSEVSFTDKAVEEAMSKALPGIEIYVPMDELLDYKAEYERLLKEKKRLEGEVARAEGKLSNEKFVGKAPAEVIQQERDKLAAYKDMLAKTLTRIPQVEEKLK